MRQIFNFNPRLSIYVIQNPPFLLAVKMAAKIRGATCATPFTSKVPTRVRLLYSLYSVAGA